MNKSSKLSHHGARRSLRAVVILVVCSLFLSGCYFTAAFRDYSRDGTVPWWCIGTPNLDQQECQLFSALLDIGVTNTSQYALLGDFTAAGAAPLGLSPSNIGVPYTLSPLPTTFDPAAPNVLLYDGNTATSRLVGLAWAVDSITPPDGFDGNRDVWVQDSLTNAWVLKAWVIRGYQNHLDVFAATHPCLTPTGSILTSTGDACYLASHTEPFEVVITNDDGIGAEGIDELVEAVWALPNTTVHIVAPAENQSGSSDVTTPPGFVVYGDSANTISGKLGTAVSSTFLDPPRNGSGSPADSVLYALKTLKLTPDIVLSGTNKGQNMSELSAASGTVGAARTARRQGVAAIASSQGGRDNIVVGPFDFPIGVAETLDLLEDWRLGRTVNTTTSVLSINIPTCEDTFVHRGVLQTVLSQCLSHNINESSCASTTDVFDGGEDDEAFFHGYVGITNVGINPLPACP